LKGNSLYDHQKKDLVGKVMKRFLKYLFTHLTFKSSHPEESDPGWEIRWTFFKISFLKRNVKKQKDPIDKNDGI